MHSGELEQRGDTVAEAHQQEPVQGRGVFDFGQVLARIQTYRRQSQHRRDS